jgi:hypothetical protein
LLGKRGLLVGQKRPTYRAKETYVQGKRGLLIGPKRPGNGAGIPRVISVPVKETYLQGKRDLLIGQKRPTYRAKETW